MKEYEIGETFEHEGKVLICTKSLCGCFLCGFHKEGREDTCRQRCVANEREDEEVVYFPEYIKPTEPTNA